MKSKTANTQSAMLNNNNNQAVKSDKAIASAASVTDKEAKNGKGIKSAASAVVVNDRDKIQSQLDRQLQQRPSATELKNRNILKDTNASPALQAAQNELQRLQLESSLDKKLSQRPNASTLVKQNILQADPSLGMLSKKTVEQSAAKAGKSKDSAQTASVKSLATVKKTTKSSDAHDPKNLQLVAHAPKDYQLVAHDAKDYQVAVHDAKDYRVAVRDEKQMQVIVSPKSASRNHFGPGLGNDSDASASNNGVMLDPKTGSPMSHAAIRKYKKLLKLRDSIVEHQNNHIAVPVSNAGILYDPMQSHKMNALVAVQQTNSNKSSAKALSGTAKPVTVAANKKGDAVAKKDSKGKANKLKEATVAASSKSSAAVEAQKKQASSRSVSPASDTRSASPTASSQQVKSNSASASKSQSAIKPAAASPQLQPLKMAPSPVMSAKHSISSVKARA